ncbi:hypothetical protein MOUN0_O06172 [Monosporozyma unispora]
MKDFKQLQSNFEELINDQNSNEVLANHCEESELLTKIMEGVKRNLLLNNDETANANDHPKPVIVEKNVKQNHSLYTAPEDIRSNIENSLSFSNLNNSVEPNTLKKGSSPDDALSSETAWFLMTYCLT